MSQVDVIVIITGAFLVLAGIAGILMPRTRGERLWHLLAVAGTGLLIIAVMLRPYI